MFFWKVDPAPLRSPVAQVVAVEPPAAPVVALLVPLWVSVPQAETVTAPTAASTKSRAPRHVLMVPLRPVIATRPLPTRHRRTTDGRKPTWTRGALKVNRK